MRLVVSLILLVSFPLAVNAKADLVVGVSILPQKYFVERIAGSKVDVVVMVGAGYNPSTYEPKPKQLSSLSKAKLFFLANVPFEKKWLRMFEKVNPAMRLVPLPSSIKFREFSEPFSHNRGDHNAHGGKDPHFWLNPLFVKYAAATIKDALIDSDPDSFDFYQKNYLAFVNDLENLNKDIQQKLSSISNKEFLVFHPSWGYFADAYGLSQIAIEVQGRQPGAKTLNAIVAKAKKMDTKIIFVQKQFSDRDASMIAKETGMRLVHIDPLAESYLDNMKLASSKIMEALR